MIIETKRLLLREMVKDDFSQLYEIFSDKQTMSYYPAPFDARRVEKWISWNLENYSRFGYGLWSIIEKKSNKLIGDCGLTNQTVDGEVEVEIGYHVNKGVWGKGFATEASLACKEYAFSKQVCEKVISLIRPENIASCRVAEKCGLKIEKEIERSGYRHYVYSCHR